MGLGLREGVELFHLGFLGELGTKLEHGLYAVKGGCNLRFFFHSVRYSEDLDIDVETTGVDTLRRKVDRLLASVSLSRTLGSQGIVVESSSRPKQTETTQRWKLGLTIEGTSTHTKIEFSRRGLGSGREFGAIDPVLTARYGLTRILVSHYGRQQALKQKVGALVGRSQTQARDVFDLELLLSAPDGIDRHAIDASIREAARERALSVDFDMFRSQVLSFLPVELQEQYDSPAIWEEMVLRVVDCLAGEGR